MAGQSNYPQSVDNYTPLVDGVDVIQADDENNSYVAHNKAQTFVGASGAPQSKNTDVLNVLDIIPTSLKPSFVDVNTIQISPGVIVCKNAAGSIRVLRKNTSTVNVTFADLDQGSRAADTEYFIWANADANQVPVTFKISTSGTSPFGVSVYALVGRFRTDGSQNIIEDSLFNKQTLIHTAGSDFSTSSASFVDVSGVSITRRTASPRVLILVNLTKMNSGQSLDCFDIAVDGTRISGVANGLVGFNQNNDAGVFKGFGFHGLKKGLAVGVHTFSLQVRTDGGTLTIALSGGFSCTLTVIELPYGDLNGI